MAEAAASFDAREQLKARRAMRTLAARHRLAVAGVCWIVFIAVAAIVAPWCLPAGYGQPSDASFAAPSAAHWMGTDLNGRDVLYRLCEGGRISLLVGLCGAIVSLVIGTSWGLLAGYLGGRADEVMMRIVDILYSVPRLIFILVCISAFNTYLQKWATGMGWDWLVTYSKIAILIVALGVIEWLTLARIVRGQTLALKERVFVTAAVALGQRQVVILWRHILPNLTGVVLIYLTLTIPAVIIDESFLSFLGLGVQAPAASWGSLLADGASQLNPVHIRWWLVVWPGVAMATTLLALNLVGDALRDVADPRKG